MPQGSLWLKIFKKSDLKSSKDRCTNKGEGCNLRPSPFHLRVLHFTFDNLALTYNKFMQLVTPSVVAMAVRMAASVWMMNFQVSFFITLTLNSKLSTLN